MKEHTAPTVEKTCNRPYYGNYEFQLDDMDIKTSSEEKQVLASRNIAITPLYMLFEHSLQYFSDIFFV